MTSFLVCHKELSRFSPSRNPTAEAPISPHTVDAMSPYTGDFWKRGETLGEHLERRGIDRREFLAWCARMAVLMGLGPMVTEGAESSAGNALASQLEALKRPVVIWLQL